MLISIRRSLNIGRDTLLCRLYKYWKSFELSQSYPLKSYRNYAILCPEVSLAKISDSTKNRDVYILVNFDSKLKESAKFWSKVHGMSVIIFSSNDKKII